MKKHIITFWAVALACLFATSCEKTLELDYDETDPLLVVDGHVNNEEIFVRLFNHSNMTDTIDEKCLTDAVVMVEGSDGYSEDLVYSDSVGCYVSPTNAVGTPGVTYTLRVKQGKRQCVAESTMPEPVAIDSVSWKWMTIINDIEIRLLYVYLTDDRTVDNYYGLYLTRGKRIMKREVASDFGLAPPFNYFSWGISSKNTIRDEVEERQKTGKRKKDVLYPGDKIVLSLRSINWDSFHYLSMLGDNSDGVNPETNLKGNDCVGYFTAYGVTKLRLVYPDVDE